MPPHTTDGGVPAHIVGRPESEIPSMDMDQHFNDAGRGFEKVDGIQ